MNREADRLVTPTELWLQWAEAHGVRYDDAGKSFDDMARDYHHTSDAYRELLTPALPGDGLSATHEAGSEHRLRTGAAHRGRHRRTGR